MKISHIVLGLGLVVGLQACSPTSPSQVDANTSDAKANGSATEEKATAVEGMTEAEIQNLVKTYQSFPALNTELKRSGTHENMLVRTHLDAKSMESFNKKSFPFANGAEIVKEGHKTEDGPTEAIFIMKKIAGYDPENGDWFYAMTNGEGMVGDKGKIQMCISCHGAARDKDFVYGFE